MVHDIAIETHWAGPFVELFLSWSHRLPWVSRWLFSHRFGLFRAFSEVPGSELGSRRAFLPFFNTVHDSVCNSWGKRPNMRLKFREEQDCYVVEHGWYFKGAQAGQHVVTKLILILIRDQLAVDFLLVPDFWHLVHQALGVGDLRSDGFRSIGEELLVTSLIVACVPFVILAIGADFEDKSQFRLFRHKDI